MSDLSFIIPTYNEEIHLPRLLSAIKKYIVNLLYEIIVVDNGSNDATLQIAKKYGAAVKIDLSKTIAGLRNLGASFATGKILVFIDADVIITQKWADNIFNVISSIKNNNLIITGSRCGISTSPSWIERHWFLPLTKEKANYINSGHLIIAKDLFHKIGEFNDTLITGEDWEFCMRAKQKNIVIFNNQNLEVIHEGYPKNLMQFIQREKWHGIQSFYNISSFLKSKPAILSLFYWLSGIFGIVFSVCYKTPLYIIASIFINSTICLLATLYRLSKYPLNVCYYFLYYHVYFFARGLALLDRIFLKYTRNNR